MGRRGFVLSEPVRLELSDYCSSHPEMWVAYSGEDGESTEYRNQVTTGPEGGDYDAVVVKFTRFGTIVGIECGSLTLEVDSNLGELAADVEALLAASRAFAAARGGNDGR